MFKDESTLFLSDYKRTIASNIKLGKDKSTFGKRPLDDLQAKRKKDVEATIAAMFQKQKSTGLSQAASITNMMTSIASQEIIRIKKSKEDEN